ncbi:lysophospholipid acyltransferase family protein [Magnetofaba australis]|uniref:Putative 1-acyl-sn-glycerol-3-phosphate acyltransferase n=1 Tax=Magnetofaba australis IT-1 TaxID=1434232 RepID=A0A1Y2K6K0_9PROT|nr:lysophospholipid acyltransferase family protein [Magnetofaba australis]OSM05259.1 putative 1-acyl-sn-glycerol-3-phosphate acyltransferase [Magnetofaba australis IT-1]
MLILLRSSVYFLLMVGGILVYGLLLSLLWPVTAIDTRRAIAASWGRYNALSLALACNLRHEIQGMENLPPPPYVIMAKHQSAWETLVFYGVFPRIAWILKESLGKIPVFGWALKATGQLFIDRSNPGEAMRMLKREGKRILGEGTSLVVFPEGTRVAPDVVGDYKAGGVGLALDSKLPIVPVAHDAGVYWPARGFLKKPGLIRVRIAPPIETATRGKHERNAILEEVKQAIESRMQQIAQERAKD